MTIGDTIDRLKFWGWMLMILALWGVAYPLFGAAPDWLGYPMLVPWTAALGYCAYRAVRSIYAGFDP